MRRRAQWVALVTVLGAVTVSRHASAQLPPAPAQDVEPSPEAKKYFQIGVDLLRDPDGAQYEEALKAFRKAYDISPSWKILGNLGLSALKLERYTDAIPAYERYLASGGDGLDPTERDQIQRDLNIMKNSSATVLLKLSNGAAAAIEDTRRRTVGGPVVNVYAIGAGDTLALKVAAGAHTFVAKAAGKEARLELDVAAGSTVDKTLDFTETASGAPTATSTPSGGAAVGVDTQSAGGGSGLRTTGLVIGGVGVAALIGGVVTEVIGLKKKSDLQTRCPNNVCAYDTPQEKDAFESDKRSLKTLGLATTGLFVGGAVLAGVGATLFIAGAPSEKSPGVALVTEVGPSGLNLVARGRF